MAGWGAGLSLALAIAASAMIREPYGREFCHQNWTTTHAAEQPEKFNGPMHYYIGRDRQWTCQLCTQ